jgi:hypothetical protein
VHLAKLLFHKPLQPRRTGQFDFRQTAWAADVGQHQTESLRRDSRKRNRHRPVRHRPDVDLDVRAVQRERVDGVKNPRLVRRLQLALGRKSDLRRMQHETSRGERFGRFDLDGQCMASLPCARREQADSIQITVAQRRRGLDGRGTGHSRRTSRHRVGIAVRRGECQYGDILKGFRGWEQPVLEPRRPRHAAFGRDHVPHGLVGFDPRPAGLAPARTVKHPDIHAQAAAFANRMLDQAPPRFGERLDAAPLDILQKDVPDKRFADPNASHRLQIARDALLGYVVRDPVPIHPGLGLVRRLSEALDQFDASIASRLCTGQIRRRQRDSHRSQPEYSHRPQNTPLHHRLLYRSVSTGTMITQGRVAVENMQRG